MSIKKHAYLIIAHTNFDQLQKLVKMLDNDKNDIFIHVDKKAKTFDKSLIYTKYSKLFCIKRATINWGGDSLINCELSLLKAAISSESEYDRYHLISGMDLPIKSQKYIHEFFDNNNKEYIEFDFRSIDLYASRVRYYYLLQNIIGRNSGLFINILSRIQDVTLRFQKRFKLERKQYMQLYKGTNWFSITDSLARYVVSMEKNIKRQFKYTFCADEIFLHTIIQQSPYKVNIVDDSLRLIDWKRGGPYTFCKNDFEEIIKSEKIFARKFDEKIDKEIIDMIVAYVDK